MKTEKTPKQVQDYIEQNSAYAVELIQKLLEDICPSLCKYCIFSDICVRKEDINLDE